MQSYRLLTGSTADLPGSYYTEHDILVLPYPYTIGDHAYVDDPQQPCDMEAFYQAMREGSMPTTSNVNQASILAAVQPVFDAGQDVVYITFTSGLTSTYQNAVMVKEYLREAYPDRTLYLVDSRCASIGQGVLVKQAVEWKESGMGAQELCEKLDELKFRIHHLITVNDLDHLYRGGRISKTSATVGKLISVKPILIINHEGQIVPYEKVNGRRKSIKRLFEKARDLSVGIREQGPIHIVHGGCRKEAEKLAQMLREQLGVKQISISYIGPVIGAHTGPDMLAVVFLGNPR